MEAVRSSETLKHASAIQHRNPKYHAKFYQCSYSYFSPVSMFTETRQIVSIADIS